MPDQAGYNPLKQRDRLARRPCNLSSGHLSTVEPQAFTLLEVTIVVAVIIFLMSMVTILSGHFRTRTRISHTVTLLEKTQNAMENYMMSFRAYPPHQHGTRQSSAALHYFLTTPFRADRPDAAKGEVPATLNAGPFTTFGERESRMVDGHTVLTDAWGRPLFYRYDVLRNSNGEVLKDALGYDIVAPALYSFGVNGEDENGLGDDIQAGKGENQK